MSLEDKLKEILKSDESGMCTPSCERGINGYEKDIAQIIDCFKEEGYQLPLQKIGRMVGSPVIEAFGAPEAPRRLMTGNEWYQRFEKELWEPPKQKRIVHGDDGESHDRFYRTGGENFMYERALEAAKKASNL